MIRAKNNVDSEGYLPFFLTNQPDFMWSIAHEKLVAKRQAVEKSERKNLSHSQAGGPPPKQLKVAG